MYPAFRKKLKCTLFFLQVMNFAGDKIEKKERGGACSGDGGGERRVQCFGGET
jgi:hypothetical protein